jgi:hypothetical protein
VSSTDSSHTSPAPIGTPSLDSEALKAVDAKVGQWDRGQGGHDPPIPDAPSQAHLTRALQDLLPGASQCGPGSNLGVEAMGSATYMISQGSQELQTVDKRMSVLDAAK